MSKRITVKSKSKPKSTVQFMQPDDPLDVDFSSGETEPSLEPMQITRAPRKKPQRSNEDARRTMDIIKSRISIIISMLEGDDDTGLKRNVSIAVNHLKQIDAMM